MKDKNGSGIMIDDRVVVHISTYFVTATVFEVYDDICCVEDDEGTTFDVIDSDCIELI